MLTGAKNGTLHLAECTMHGFDTVFHAPTSQAMLKKRTAYIRQMFAC